MDQAHLRYDQTFCKTVVIFMPSNVFIISAPSGTGKTSLNSRLVKEVPQVEVIVSLTSRPKRQGEIDNISYKFVTKEQFQDYINRGDMLEYAEVFGNLYGTRHSEVKKCLEQGKKIILEIDVQGCKNVKAKMKDAVSVFILPPSVASIWKRLESRGTDSLETRQRRFRDARKEIEHASAFDMYIINETFDDAFADLRGIVVEGKPSRVKREDAMKLCERLLKEFDEWNESLHEKEA